MEGHYPFKLPILPYELNSLEPYVSKETMYYHYEKLFQTYIDNLNKTLKPYPMYYDWTLEQLIINTNELPDEIQVPISRYAGGTYNHDLYFNSMTPYDPRECTLTKDMNAAVNYFFGSFEGLKHSMKTAGMNVYGSGWTFLVADLNNGLYIVDLPNQEVPLSETSWPILPMDVWEHAYYLQYKNRRDESIDNWFNIVDWIGVCRRVDFIKM